MRTALIDQVALYAGVVHEVVTDWRVGAAGAHRAWAHEAALALSAWTTSTIAIAATLAAWSALTIRARALSALLAKAGWHDHLIAASIDVGRRHGHRSLRWRNVERLCRALRTGTASERGIAVLATTGLG